jgi:hypothetical protein
LEPKTLWLAVVPALALWATGCGGIQASHSVSPASFLLPGLLQKDSKNPEIPALVQDQSPNSGLVCELTRNLTQSN